VEGTRQESSALLESGLQIALLEQAAPERHLDGAGYSAPAASDSAGV